jgi:hypothetical protein
VEQFLEGGALMRWLLVITLLAAPRLVRADDEIAKGAVVRIEAKEIYVSVGSDRGITDGASLRIKRPITLHHPVTHAAVTDWIPIGSAQVTQAGAVMSRAVVGDLVAEIKVGDVCEVLVVRPDAPHPAQERVPAPPVDPQTADVLAEFAAQVNQSLDVRIAGWERYLSMHAGSPYAAGVRRDLDELRTLRDQLRPASAARNAEVIATVAHSQPHTAQAGTQIPLVFVLDQPERVASAYLHVRPAGAPTYHAMLLAREHDIYLRGQVPPELVTSPGVEYFVEVSAPDGHTGLALASPQQPIYVDVPEPPLLDRFGSIPGRSSVHMTGEYLDFRTFDNRAGDRTDRLVSGNVDFTYWLGNIVQSLGVGYGVYAGAGGSKDAVWGPGMTLPHTGFQYGYADIELGGHLEKVPASVGGQVIAGVGRTGFGMGVEARVRVGAPVGTNVLFSTRSIDQVGYLSEVRFGTWPVQHVGLGVSVGATNQPDRGEVAVKLGTELEFAVRHDVSLLLRGSWQGRSVVHSGAGGGAGLGFSW